MDLTPQLRMLKPTLSDLPELALPEGFSLRSYEAGDSAHWERILAASFGGEPGRFSFDRIMRRDAAFRADRVLFAVVRGVPVATASAWRAPGLMPATGMVHFVGAMPEFQGQRLGYWVTLATLHHLAAEGLRAATLTTDDFRLAAIKTYLRLGFEPVLVHENQRERWRQVWRELRLPEQETRFAALLAGPLWQPPVHPEDGTDYARILVRRRRQHPERPVGGLGLGDDDALADESLYHPGLLGRAGASVSTVVAGADCPFELWFEAGPAGLPTGSEIRFCAMGGSPFSAAEQAAEPDGSFAAERHYVGKARLHALPATGVTVPDPDGAPLSASSEPGALGFVVEQGMLAPGERVTLSYGVKGACRWTPSAGRLEIKVLVNPGRGEPVLRLPEPVVIRIVAATPARVEAFLPGTAWPGEPLVASVRVADGFGNRVPMDVRGRLHCGPRRFSLPLHGGAGRADLGAMGTGPVSWRVNVPGLPARRSNTVVPRGDDGLGLYFGDLQAPVAATAAGWTDEVYRWARQERRLDFVSVIPQSPTWLDNERWALHKHAAEAHLDEGCFVTFLGFAWRHSHYGTRLVHFLGGDSPYLPADDPRYAYPARLHEALRATDALLAYGPPCGSFRQPAAATDWAAIEPGEERLVGLCHEHGWDGAWEVGGQRLRSPHPEAGLLGALRSGLRLGFTSGSGPSDGRLDGSLCRPCHDGGGLCAVWAEDLTRRALFAALLARRTYAVSGRRIVLRFAVNDAPMGAELPFVDTLSIRLQAWAEEPIAKVEVVRDGLSWRVVEPGRTAFDSTFADTLDQPAFYYARITLADGSLAICSPVWIG